MDVSLDVGSKNVLYQCSTNKPSILPIFQREEILEYYLAIFMS